METFAELMEKVTALFPDAQVEEDSNGDLVVYTGLRELPDGKGTLAKSNPIF